MNETQEKIKNGTIRIEKGRLIGLGVCESESIDLTALDELMDCIGRDGVVTAVSEAISTFADVHTECCFADEHKSKEPSEFVNENIRPILRSLETFKLHQIVKCFSK